MFRGGRGGRLVWGYGLGRRRIPEHFDGLVAHRVQVRNVRIQASLIPAHCAFASGLAALMKPGHKVGRPAADNDRDQRRNWFIRALRRQPAFGDD